VRHLLQNKKTLMYFRNGEWTPDRDLAQDFRDAHAVVGTIMKYNLLDVQVVFQMGDKPSAHDDICLPPPEGPRHGP